MGYEWDLQSPSSPVCTYEGHQGYLHAIAVSSATFSMTARVPEDHSWAELPPHPHPPLLH